MSKLMIAGLVILLIFCSEEGLTMEPIIKVLRTEETPTANLLQNGDLEGVDGEILHVWSPYKQGYEVAQGAGRDGSTAAYCENGSGRKEKGISQSVELERDAPIPLMVRGWSKAQDVSGSKSSGYSIYVDVVFQDGTPLWGQTGTFNTGTHDWEMQEFLILPNKPVARISIYGMFRGHTGQAWFDDFQLYELGGSGIQMLDGVPVDMDGSSTVEEDEFMAIHEVSTGDGLTLAYDFVQGTVASLKLDDRELLQSRVPSGFLVRDVAADSDFYGFEGGVCAELGLALEWQPEHETGKRLQIWGEITDTTGEDRAITLMFALPMDAVGWKWHDDVRHSRTIEEGMEYINGANIHTGSTGIMSLYPFGSISDDENGLALAIDMDVPAQYRIAYNSSTKQFFIAYDFGLAKETDRFQGAAPFRFVLYRTDPQWGFRSAAKKLYEIFPDYFVCRSKDQGIWMPFTDVSTVQGWEDFGFKYHEGINNVPFDDKANVLSFRYTEPSTWWMSMDPEIERTDENIIKQLQEYAESDESRRRRGAEATIVSGSFDEQERYQYLVRNTPWSNGAVFSSNPNPYIPGNSEARMYWNEESKRRLYGPDAKGEQDGEYLDSLEAYVTADENFRREHFHYVTAPLTFSTSSKKPTIHKASSVYEFSKWLAKDVHKMGKLMFANSVPHRFAFLCPFFDVMGTEMNWIGSDGGWNPASDSWMNLKRTMCYQKPYLFLMNTRYEKFTPDLVEKYFQRSLFYGMFPSMFSHNASEDPYWGAPELYNRDRHLFKRYIPIIKKVAEAGWEPITYALTDNDDVYIERFGPDEKGNVYFTLLNDSAEAQNMLVTFMASELNLAIPSTSEDIISGDEIEFPTESGQVKVELAMSPEQVRLFVFKHNVR
ncbi:hypothetical protein ACFL6S_10100 [Candidatus Poribacteria bacterium]